MMSTLVHRARELGEMLEHFRRGEWCAVIAPALSGKSTLAQQLVAETEKAHPAWRVIYVKFEPAGTVEGAWCQISRHLNENACGLPRSRTRRIADALDEFLRETKTVHCVVLDDLDVLPDEVLRLLALELRRFRNFGGFARERKRFRCAFMGAVKLLGLTGEESPLRDIIESVTLPDFTKEEAAQALLGRLKQGSISPECEETLFAETAGHPYLVSVIAERLLELSQEPTSEAIGDAASYWSHSVGGSPLTANPCFQHVVEYIEIDDRAFEVVLSLLEHQCEAQVVPGIDDNVSMCGAVTERNGRFVFRGRMLARAMKGFMDDLRTGDYWCLHGQWGKAQEFYERVSSREIQQRREEASARAINDVLDLYLRVSPYGVRRRTLADAEEFVARTGRHFFGADQVRLWRLEPNGSFHLSANIADSLSENIPQRRPRDTAAAAARNQTALTLANNEGVIQGIGDDPTKTRWALELYYALGLPGGNWVAHALQHAKTPLHTILDRARQREFEDLQHREQRVLIHEIALRLQGATHLRDVFSLIVDGVRDRLHYECVQLSLVFPEEGLIRAVRSNGVFDTIRKMTVREVDGNDILAVVVRKKAFHIVNDCSEPDSLCEQDTVRISGMKSLVVVPLLDSNEAIGVLQVGDTHRYSAFDETDAQLLQLLADGAAIAIRMARERETLELVSEATENAVAVIDAAGIITSCNDIYRAFFGKAAGDKSSLTVDSDSDESEHLVRIAFRRTQPFHTIRERDGRTYIATAASLEDPFHRYAGGVESVGTRSPLCGLTDALSSMLRMGSSQELGQAMTNCLCSHLNYARARFYVARADGRELVSQWSEGMDAKRADRFRDGDFILTRSSNDCDGDGFECIRHDSPVILVRFSLAPAEFRRANLPIRQMVRDSQQRPVVVLEEEDVLHVDELGKRELVEWVDVPVGTAEFPIGKLSVDLKDTGRQLGIEDVETLALFGRWATEAMTRLMKLEEARKQADIVRDVRLLGDRRGLEALAWDFLLNITLAGGPGFNRAALFLKHPQSGQVHGFLCHGASSSDEWGLSIKSLKVSGDRGQFMAETRRKKMQDPFSEDDRRRIEALRHTVILEDAPGCPFAQAMTERHVVRVTAASEAIQGFCESLGWEPPETALISPLIYEGECEGLVYVDRAFMGTKELTQRDEELLETLAFHLAAIARPLRLAEQLRSQILGVSHTTVTPVAAIRGLAEALKSIHTDGTSHRHLDLIVAESQRAADILRRLLRVTGLSTQPLEAMLSATNVNELLEQRIAPYLALLEADSIQTTLKLPAAPIVANVDAGLLGDVFAELAANAHLALRTADVVSGRPIFRVRCGLTEEGTGFFAVFENSGPPIPVNGRDHIFDRFVSATGGTGVGLWLARQIISLHGGRIHYEVSQEGWSQFHVVVPLRRVTC